jgi:hypothetical protein
MNKVRLAFCASLFATITLTFASLGQAQATRTWVSGVGDDVNPCSRTAPCKTFAGAIAKTATGGEIDALDSGGFGSVTISKSITIDGTPMLAGVLAPSGSTGIIINITDPKDAAKSVRLRGLSINGVGTGKYGVNVIAASNVTVEDSVIDGFVTSGINVAAGAVFVKKTTIRNNVGPGINVATGGQVAMTDVSLIFNGTATAGAASSITSSNNVVLYGNKR